jgi:hypothetical protein
MKFVLSAILVGGFIAGALLSPNAWAQKVTLSDELLMTFDDTYVTPKVWYADLTGSEDLPGLGVEYSVSLYGAWGIEVGIGGASPVADLSSYSQYVLTMTNTSAGDSYNASLYIKTGDDLTTYRSGWSMFFPGRSRELSLNLTGIPLADLTDVREIGFSLGVWVGSDYGYADGTIQIKVEDDPAEIALRPGSPVPEASTLMLFGTGLIGLLAIARRKISFLR